MLGAPLIAALICAMCANAGGEDHDDLDMEGLLKVMKNTHGKLVLDDDLPSRSFEILSPANAGVFSTKGVAPGDAPVTPSSSLSSGARKKFRKFSTDHESHAAAAKMQAVQRERLRIAYHAGKQQVQLLSTTDHTNHTRWDVACDSTFYTHAYGVVKDCTPTRCSRVVRDDFASKEDCDVLFRATQIAMKNLFHQGGTTSLAPASSAKRIGMHAHLLYQMYAIKAKLQIMNDYGCKELYDSGALLTRLIADPPRDEWELEAGHVYWNAHVDKANIPTYDYSALLYLNTQGSDFEGGDFAFIDDDADRIVAPIRGRLVTFTSGPENLHQVREVTKGQRLVLAMWFTCSEEHRFRDDD